MPQNPLDLLRALLLQGRDPNYPDEQHPPVDTQPFHPGATQWASRLEDIALPAGPKQDLPPQFQAGDPALDRRDITSSTNYIPGVSHADSVGMERGITMREDRDDWLSGPAYGKMIKQLIEQGQQAHKRRLLGQPE